MSIGDSVGEKAAEQIRQAVDELGPEMQQVVTKIEGVPAAWLQAAEGLTITITITRKPLGA